MNTPRTSVSKTVRALQKLGLNVTGVEVAPDGTVKVLTQAANESADDELERARDRRRARKAGRTAQGDEAA
uniref:Uncharacterized protein n=1 Tax=viral metagenome TaxID=1070528 RepID=A0A6H1ZCS6_9ZZZZ